MDFSLKKQTQRSIKRIYYIKIDGLDLSKCSHVDNNDSNNSSNNKTGKLESLAKVSNKWEKIK